MPHKIYDKQNICFTLLITKYCCPHAIKNHKQIKQNVVYCKSFKAQLYFDIALKLCVISNLYSAIFTLFKIMIFFYQGRFLSNNNIYINYIIKSNFCIYNFFFECHTVRIEPINI